MSDFSVTKEEWKVAHQYLDHADDGTKLPYTYSANANKELIRKTKADLNQANYKTTHSFIKLSGNIYAIAQGKGAESVLVETRGSKIKYAKNEDDTMMLMKINASWHGNDEAMIMADLAVSPASGMRRRSTKQYAAMAYLGSDLNAFLEKNKETLTPEQRLDIAIKLSWQVYRLHSGQASLTHAQYAHMDLKPSNVTIDDAGDVHLIDFGHALRLPQQSGGSRTGAYLWVAYNRHEQPLTRERYDVVALKRTLFMPKSFYCAGGFVEVESGGPACVLTEEQLTNAGLNQFINTHADDDNPPDHSKDTETAATLTALLIAEKLKLDIKHETIANFSDVAEVIIGLYFANRSNEINQVIADPRMLVLVTTLCDVNKLEQLEIYKNDDVLMKALCEASTKTAAAALIHLKDNGLQQHYSKVIRYPSMADNVVELARENLSRHIKTLFDDPMKLAAISLLRKNRYECYDKACYKALANWDKKVNFNPDKVHDYYHAVIKSAHAAKAIVRYCQLGQHVNPSTLFKFAEISKLRKAANILLKSNVIDTSFIDYVVTDYSERFSSKNNVADLIIALDKLNLSAVFPLLANERELAEPISRIIKESTFNNKLTAEMLANKQARNILEKYLCGHSDKYDGFQSLFTAGVFNSQLDLPELNSLIYDFGIQQHPVYYLINAACQLNIKFNGTPPDSYLKFITASQENAKLIYELLSSDPFIWTSKAELLCKQLEKFAPENRLSVVIDLCSPSELKKMHDSKSIVDWRKFKSLLPNNDRRKIDELIYSEDELAAKDVLKNIRNEIRNTRWPDDKTTGTYFFKGNMISAPSVVGRQMGAFEQVTLREQTHTEALASIKELGKQAVKKQDKLVASINHSLFGKRKTITEEYVDKFKNEEAFNSAFRKTS